jgi:hypothetical protein
MGAWQGQVAPLEVESHSDYAKRVWRIDEINEGSG